MVNGKCKTHTLLTSSQRNRLTLWAHISGKAVTEKRKRSHPPQNAPLYKRQNAIQSELDAARKLVALAVAEAEEQNLSIKQNPTRNSYIARPVNGTNTKIRRDGISSSVISATIASAAALVAEADAQQLAASGTLFKEYTLTRKYAKYSMFSFRHGLCFSGLFLGGMQKQKFLDQTCLKATSSQPRVFSSFAQANMMQINLASLLVQSSKSGILIISWGTWLAGILAPFCWFQK